MKNIKNQQDRKVNFFRCGLETDKQKIFKHSKVCPARKATCGKCGREGHYKDYCKSVQPVNEVDESNDDTEDVNTLSYSVNVFRVKASMKGNDCDFKSELMVNGKLDTVLADTGAKVSVCRLKKAM